MKRMTWGAAALVALSGCSGRLPHPTYSAHKTEELVVVPYPPPPPKVEEIPDRPGSDAVWIDGEWQWRRRRWAWRAGRWVTEEKDRTWSPWTVTRDEAGTLYFAPGFWRDASGAAILPEEMRQKDDEAR